MSITLRNTHKITNTALLSIPVDSDYFIIKQEGEWINRDEFVSMQMKAYGLRTRTLIERALSTVGQ